MKLFLRLVAAAWCCCAATGLNAHSGKARFHLIVDTDGAADDLRTICMLLGNREAEVLAITTSEGALEPLPAARRAAALLAEFHHEGIPVGAGRRTGLPAPPWRAHSERIVWGAPLSDTLRFAGARELILSALAGEEEPVIFVALGSLTNLHDALEADPSAANRIGRIVWYDDTPQTGEGANFRADRRAASAVLASGIPVEIVSEAAGEPIPVTRRSMPASSRRRTAPRRSPGWWTRDICGPGTIWSSSGSSRRRRSSASRRAGRRCSVVRRATMRQDGSVRPHSPSCAGNPMPRAGSSTDFPRSPDSMPPMSRRGSTKPSRATARANGAPRC